MKAKHRISEEINLAVIIMTIIISITIVISLMLQRRFPAESWLFLQVKAEIFSCFDILRLLVSIIYIYMTLKFYKSSVSNVVCLCVFHHKLETLLSKATLVSLHKSSLLQLLMNFVSVLCDLNKLYPVSSEKGRVVSK